MTESAVANHSIRLTYPWMFGRYFDLTFFFAPILLGFALFLASQSMYAANSFIFSVLILNAFGAGPFHWGPTWFAYFDKRNRHHFASTKRLRAIFFFGPPIILLVATIGMFIAPWLVFTITSIWAIQHLVQQNIGILLLYHNPRAGEAIVAKELEIRSQWAPAIFFSMLFIQRIIMKGIAVHFLVTALIAITGIWALFCVYLYLRDLQTQVSKGASLNVPALTFWIVSVLSLLPFAFFGKGMDDAFVMPVTVHWFQYIGLNYILVKYKYLEGAEEHLPAKRPIMLLGIVSSLFLTVGLCLLLLKKGIQIENSAAILAVIGGLSFGLANCHYFLDAFLWRFREEYQRKTILPHLLTPRQQRG